MDGDDPSNWEVFLNLSHDSKAPYNDPSEDENSSNASYMTTLVMMTLLMMNLRLSYWMTLLQKILC